MPRKRPRRPDQTHHPRRARAPGPNPEAAGEAASCRDRTPALFRGRKRSLTLVLSADGGGSAPRTSGPSPYVGVNAPDPGPRGRPRRQRRGKESATVYADVSEPEQSHPTSAVPAGKEENPCPQPDLADSPPPKGGGVHLPDVGFVGKGRRDLTSPSATRRRVGDCFRR